MILRESRLQKSLEIGQNILPEVTLFRHKCHNSQPLVNILKGLN